MNDHLLFLNASKTEIMLIGPNSKLKQVQIHGVVLHDGTCLRFHETAKNLGVYFDSTLKFDTQINKVISTSYLALRNISRMKKYLNVSQLTALCNALVLSKLDYANSLYFGITAHQLSKLQMVQNSAARLIFSRKRRESIHDAISNVHWLRVRERIYFKIIIIMFKCIIGLAPKYLDNLLTISLSHHVLFCEPRVNSSFGDRAFFKCGPKLWNSLPTTIRNIRNLSTFKSSLKYFLFNNCVDFHHKLQIV